VNVSSIGARFANPLLGVYHASKHALYGLSEALALECRPYGVRVVNVEPGMVGTDFSANVRRTGALVLGEGPYVDLAGEIREGFGAWRRRYEVPADDVARAVLRAATDPDAPFRMPVGDDAAMLARTRAHVDDATWHDALVDFLGTSSLRRA
jgi:NAD(P)-dependent dehydrogenase (short-subunit alcohol dehydrogenase family)